MYMYQEVTCNPIQTSPCNSKSNTADKNIHLWRINIIGSKDGEHLPYTTQPDGKSTRDKTQYLRQQNKPNYTPIHIDRVEK